MTPQHAHLYGPVPSRRLGLSLGVDIVPAKVCTLDCIYCQIGRTSLATLVRKPYVAASQVLVELRERIRHGLACDYITLTGSGEPTLNTELGCLIDQIRTLTDIPIALITNGTLLHHRDVRSDAAKADVVLPSLDAGNEAAFRKINRPCPGLDFQTFLQGLVDFRTLYVGPMWLEVFLVEGVNTSDPEIESLKACIARVRPDKIHLNTAVRPTAEPGIDPLEPALLQAIAQRFGPTCEVIADFPVADGGHRPDARCSLTPTDRIAESIFAMLKRRPCSIDDLSNALALSRASILAAVKVLTAAGRIHAISKAGRRFYAPVHDQPPTD